MLCRQSNSVESTEGVPTLFYRDVKSATVDARILVIFVASAVYAGRYLLFSNSPLKFFPALIASTLKVYKMASY